MLKGNSVRASAENLRGELIQPGETAATIPCEKYIFSERTSSWRTTASSWPARTNPALYEIQVMPFPVMNLYPIDGTVHRIGRTDTAFSYREATWAAVVVDVDPDPANSRLRAVSWGAK